MLCGHVTNIKWMLSQFVLKVETLSPGAEQLLVWDNCSLPLDFYYVLWFWCIF